MKKIILTLTALIALAVPASASAHSEPWYWSSAKAERALVSNEVDIYSAECHGEGRRRFHGLYKHFWCDTYDQHGNGLGTLTFHVRSKNTYSITWWGE
jgi:hypothetical protein